MTLVARAGAAIVAIVGVAAACATAPVPAPSAPATSPQPSSSATALRAAAVGHAKVGSAQAEAARVILSAALAPGAEQRWQRRRDLSVVVSGAGFAFDDAWSLLAQAPRPGRAALLAAMAPALAERSVILAEEQAQIASAARDAGLSASELVARRVGLDERALAALVAEILGATEELLGPVAADVTLIPDVLVPPPWRERSAPAAAPPGPHAPATEWALHYGDVPRSPTPDDAAAFARALTVELRLVALSLRALSAPPAEHDALASRALVDGADVVAGAAALLDLDPSGVVAERFVGLLRAPTVVRARWANEPLAAVAARLDQARPPDEEGYPEAYVALVRLLPEL